MAQIKILSFGDESLRVVLSYLPKIAKCDSVGVVSGILYAEDETADSVYEKIKNDLAEFIFLYNNEGSVRFNTAEDFSAAKALDWLDWDFVVLSDVLGAEKVSGLRDFVKNLSPESDVIINCESSSDAKIQNNADMILSVSDILADAEKIISQRGFNVDMNSGRIKDFLTACVLYEKITGNNVAENKYRLPFVEREVTEIIKCVVHEYCTKD